MLPQEISGSELSMRPALNVIHVVSGLFVGGGQLGAIDLVKQLTASGVVNAHLCFLGKPECQLRDDGSTFIAGYDGNYANPLILWQTVRALRCHFKQKIPHIVHSHGWDSDLIAALAVHGLGIKHVSHIHALSTWAKNPGFKRRLRLWLTRWALANSKAEFIAVSEAAKASACKHLGLACGRVHTVLNGVDLEGFSRIDKARRTRFPEGRGTMVVGTAARLAPEKGLGVLIESISLLGPTHSGVKVRIAGQGRMAEALGEFAQTLGVSNQIEFLGMVEDMPAFYQELDVFVLPSFTEGLPRTVIEAMASGVPVIATRVGGVSELVRDGIDGALINPAKPGELAKEIARLFGNPTLRHQMGIAARRRARSAFGLDRVTSQVNEVYLGLVGY